MIPNEDFRLLQILAVYLQGEAEDGRCYVEAHPVELRRGKPVLQAGKPLSLAAIKRLGLALDKETLLAGHGLLPERVLVAAPAGDLAWWSPAGPRHLRLGPDIGLASGTAEIPALCFALLKTSLYAFALDTGDQRPGPKAKLFRLPLWNCHGDGAMCMGSARFEREGTAAKRVEAAEAAFWDSNFCAHLGDPDALKGKGSIRDLWAQLIGSKKRFPVKRLKPTGKTLGDFLAKGGF